jgi:hypothetical protein
MENKIKCPKCGYEFSKSNENKCPRCGSIISDCRGCSGNCSKCNMNRNKKIV